MVSTPKNTKFHLERIDLLRGVAILLVLAYHTQLYLFHGFEVNEWDANGWLTLPSFRSFVLNFNPIGNGWIGVELFLIISGFLIHLIQMRSGSTFNAATFFSKRFWRIYPPYILVLTFFFLARPDFSLAGIKNYVLHALMLHNLGSNEVFFGISPSFWSIALEVQLYAVYPIVLAFINRSSLPKVFFASLLISCLFAVIITLRPDWGSQFWFANNLLRFWVVWGTGAFLAYRFKEQRPFFSRPWLATVILYLIFLAAKAHEWSVHFTLIFATFACAALFEAVLYSNTSTQKGWLVRKSTQLLSLIGLCSYSIYLIHQPYLAPLLAFFDPHTPWGLYNRFQQIGFSWLLIFLVSYASYRLLELPSIEFGKRRREGKES